MSAEDARPSDVWSAALRAAEIIAVDPRAVGGVVVRCRPGVARDRWFEFASQLLTQGAPLKRAPLHIADDRLIGGLDLAATLRAGAPVAQRGLLSEADGGVVVLQCAERASSASAARIVSAMDSGEVRIERDGFSATNPARFGVIAFDEGIGDDERPPASLIDRCAFLIDLDGVSHRDAIPPLADADAVAAIRAAVAEVSIGDDLIEALCAAAVAMGVLSMRASMLAVRVARTIAAISGRAAVVAEDAAEAAALVLAPRATRWPDTPANDRDDAPTPPPPDASEPEPGDDTRSIEDGQMADIVLEAMKAAVPPGLLAALQGRDRRKRRAAGAGRAGEKRSAPRHGRPAGVRRGELKGGARLNLVETLRSAAPWQPLRRRASRAGRKRVVIEKDDFRIARFKTPVETTMIFVVDASGSSALNRLAEAKGAVELLLADCYVRRDRVALISFRGKSAELLLPPTRSLARAKRCLSGLPGGGGTPLALALDAAAALADAARRKGQTPNIVVMTDGRANVARDGAPGRPKAESDALAAARAIHASDIGSIVIDTSPHAAEQSERLAVAMGAVYLPLPRADAQQVSRAVRLQASDAAPRRA